MKIRWIPKDTPDDGAVAKVGNMRLQCIRTGPDTASESPGSNRWYAHVHMYGVYYSIRCGSKRKSLARAKEDAVRIVRELISDAQLCLAIEMKNFE